MTKDFVGTALVTKKGQGGNSAISCLAAGGMKASTNSHPPDPAPQNKKKKKELGGPNIWKGWVVLCKEAIPFQEWRAKKQLEMMTTTLRSQIKYVGFYMKKTSSAKRMQTNTWKNIYLGHINKTSGKRCKQTLEKKLMDTLEFLSTKGLQ